VDRGWYRGVLGLGIKDSNCHLLVLLLPSCPGKCAIWGNGVSTGKGSVIVKMLTFRSFGPTGGYWVA
jgi:hypothetical protein